MYNRTCPDGTVREGSRFRFAKVVKSIESIPSTKPGFSQNVKKAAYQAGYVWVQSLKGTSLF